jgi:transcriptional regulator with XRE-family HTH domain
MPQPTRVTETIAGNVKRLRRQRDGMSARELAERCRAAGVPFDRDAIASLENGRRQHVTVDQLLALASALETRPVALLVELGEDPLSAADVETMAPVDPDLQVALDGVIDRARHAGLSLRDVLDYVRMTWALRGYVDLRGVELAWPQPDEEES